LNMKRVLVTGGSGFIGTNVVESFLAGGDNVINIDIKEPQNKQDNKVYRRTDIRNQKQLLKVFKDFAPTHVVHLAARTDLHEKKNIKGYDTNTLGVRNMVSAVSAIPSVARCIFTSTKLVCPTDYTPKSEDDYCPDTIYGRSKVAGEKIVKSSTTMKCDWCIIRPTSIWGPWSLLPHIPYGQFFRMIAKGRYFHPGRVDSPKTFGYVGNVIFQIKKILDASREQICAKVFYVSDYDVFTIKSWADIISRKLRSRNVRVIPEPLVHLLAWGGNILKCCGVKEPVFSSFRLRNMRADTTGIPIKNTEEITGPLPYSLEQGVDETIAWLRKYNHIS